MPSHRWVSISFSSVNAVSNAAAIHLELCFTRTTATMPPASRGTLILSAISLAAGTSIGQLTLNFALARLRRWQRYRGLLERSIIFKSVASESDLPWAGLIRDQTQEYPRPIAVIESALVKFSAPKYVSDRLPPALNNFVLHNDPGSVRQFRKFGHRFSASAIAPVVTPTRLFGPSLRPGAKYAVPRISSSIE